MLFHFAVAGRAGNGLWVKVLHSSKGFPFLSLHFFFVVHQGSRMPAETSSKQQSSCCATNLRRSPVVFYLEFMPPYPYQFIYLFCAQPLMKKVSNYTNPLSCRTSNAICFMCNERRASASSFPSAQRSRILKAMAPRAVAPAAAAHPPPPARLPRHRQRVSQLRRPRRQRQQQLVPIRRLLPLGQRRPWAVSAAGPNGHPPLIRHLSNPSLSPLFSAILGAILSVTFCVTCLGLLAFSPARRQRIRRLFRRSNSAVRYSRVSHQKIDKFLRILCVLKRRVSLLLLHFANTYRFFLEYTLLNIRKHVFEFFCLFFFFLIFAGAIQ